MGGTLMSWWGWCGWGCEHGGRWKLFESTHVLVIYLHSGCCPVGTARVTILHVLTGAERGLGLACKGAELKSGVSPAFRP
jgi:hypothetical protein